MTSYAIVNTADGTITSTGQTTTAAPNVPQGATVISDDQYNTIVATAAAGGQCKLVSGTVILMPTPTPTTASLAQIQAAAYVQIDTAAEAAREQFLTPGSGQAIEYQETAADAARLLATLAVTGAASVQTQAPRVGTAQPAAASATGLPAAPAIAEPDPADYPWLASEQQALAANGITMSLSDIASAVIATMDAWQTAGSAIKLVRRQAKIAVALAKTADAISAILGGLTWPTNTAIASQGLIPGT